MASRIRALFSHLGTIARPLFATPSSDPRRRSRVLYLQDKTRRGYRIPELSEHEARAQLLPLIERFAPGMPGPSGKIASLTLVGESRDAGGDLRRYRAVFANGASIISTIVIAPDRRRRSISFETESDQTDSTERPHGRA